MSQAPLLSVKNLKVRFTTHDGLVHAVNDVSFDIEQGQKLALVGESGSGKSQVAFAIMRLLANNGYTEGSIELYGRDLLTMKLAELNRIRSKQIAIIFQDPMTSLNPYMRIVDQLTEVLLLHEGMTKAQAKQRVLEVMDAVQIPDARNRINAYVHELSGGMRQRIVIAMALLCRPQLILADEPTTALDVTVQAQIMALLDEIQKEFNTAILLITHDLGVVANYCDEVMVFYGGRIMERAATSDIFARATHPYTRGLLRAVPNIYAENEQLEEIPGNPPDMLTELAGCPFATRCVDAIDTCFQQVPDLSRVSPHRACLRAVEDLS